MNSADVRRSATAVVVAAHHSLATTGGAEVTVESLKQFAETFADLGDPDVMRGAWD